VTSDLSPAPPASVGHSTRVVGGQVSMSSYPVPTASRPGPRGSVSSFSPSSRLRLGRFLLRLPWPNEEVGFCTLTFAEDLDGKRAKACLNTLHTWFGRHYPLGELVWKLEFTKRGRHHFHLLARPVPGSPLPVDFGARLEAQWRFRMRCGFILVNRVYSRSGAIRYFSEYLSKKDGPKSYQEQVPPGVWSGRFWGVWGHPYLLPEVVLRLTDAQFSFLLGVVNAFLQRGGSSFRFRAHRTSKRDDAPLAYLVRAVCTGESVSPLERVLMTDDERSTWDTLVQSGFVHWLWRNFPRGDLEGDPV
jgi:hypothetical protein